MREESKGGVGSARRKGTNKVIRRRCHSRVITLSPRSVSAAFSLSLSPLILSLSSSSSSSFCLPLSLSRAGARETASSRAEMVARGLRAGSSKTGDRVACVAARGIHTRGASRVTRVARDRRKGERSSVAPRRARATVQIRLSGPLAQAEAGHSASGAWRTPVEACARTAAARERDGATDGATTGPLRTCITTT